MKRLLSISFALLVAGLLCIAQSPAYWQSRVQSSVGGAAFQGIGDVVSGAFAAYATYSCYNAAYSGNVIDVYAPSDASNTLVTCSAGGTINETLQALSTTCATSCTIKTWYDMSGAAACSGGACDVTQATEAQRATLVSNTPASGKWCALFSGSVAGYTSSASSGTKTQPFSGAAVVRRTGNFGSNGAWISGNNSPTTFRFRGAADNPATYSGAFIDGTLTDNTFGSVVNIASSSVGNICINGTCVGAGNSGSNDWDGNVLLGTDFFTTPLTGNLCEATVWRADVTSNASNLSANQHTRWGF